MNYLVACTANLGVVPLLRLAAFLLAPEALFLALRRFSVIAVLEAIDISRFSTHYLSVLKLLNLTVGLFFVKVFLLLPVAAFAQVSTSDVILAKGEQKELSFKGLKNFSVGNSEVISYKFSQKSGKLLIKGKKVGFTDLIVWTKEGKSTLSLYVLSKQKFLKTFQLADALKNLNLSIDIKGPIMTASGVLSDFSDYLYLQKIKGQFQEQVFFKITIDSKLRNHIIGQIYKKLYANGFSSVTCQVDWLEVMCFYAGNDNAALLKQLASFYRVSFIQQDSRLRHKNYRLKLKLIQLERMDGREIHMGLDKLQAKLSDLFTYGMIKLIEDNMVFLGKSSMELSSLAEPEMVINLHTPQVIEIGSQIPYQNIGVQGNAVIAPIEWRFAGLKIKTKITEAYGKILFDYETEFSRPVEQAISGSKEISSALLEVGVPMKIFQIGFQTNTKGRQGIPFISDIPILKHLFESKSDQKTYKQIYGYVVLEEM
ncbi:MAG TPA: pilus assembly protein N-terminal domain-containing protein [Bacteriovoracaceae bacterium]|nr:pilus assembly protein N-terminal domain-containing protein [Bacteriovoracaceae bacterium]